MICWNDAASLIPLLGFDVATKDLYLRVIISTSSLFDGAFRTTSFTLVDINNQLKRCRLAYCLYLSCREFFIVHLCNITIEFFFLIVYWSVYIPYGEFDGSIINFVFFIFSQLLLTSYIFPCLLCVNNVLLDVHNCLYKLFCDGCMIFLTSLSMTFFVFLYLVRYVSIWQTANFQVSSTWFSSIKSSISSPIPDASIIRWANWSNFDLSMIASLMLQFVNTIDSSATLEVLTASLVEILF